MIKRDLTIDSLHASNFISLAFIMSEDLRESANEPSYPFAPFPCLLTMIKDAFKVSRTFSLNSD